MLYIAIVENEKPFADRLKELVSGWVQKRSISTLLELRTFSSGEEFLESDLEDYRVVFMAIKLAGSLNGIETAKCLRERKYLTPVIYTTSYKEHVFEGYQVKAFDFLIKPVSQDRIEKCLDRIMEMNAAGVQTIRTKSTIQKIPYNDMMYVQSFKHYVEIHTAEKDYKQLIAFSKMMEELPLQFSRCHRTMIINLNYVKEISGAEVEMKDGQRFPISASYLNDFRESFLKNTLI